jgi:hypothetical protein
LFPEEIGVIVEDSISCETDDATVFDGAPVCETGIDDASGDQDVFIKITTLKTRQRQYPIRIAQGFINPPSAIRGEITMSTYKDVAMT